MYRYGRHTRQVFWFISSFEILKPIIGLVADPDDASTRSVCPRHLQDQDPANGL